MKIPHTDLIRQQDPQWLQDLQSYANKSTFWIFSLAFPWKHPMVPKYMLNNNLTMMSDGFPFIRFKVLEGGKYYQLLQYQFHLGWDGKGPLKPSEKGSLLRFMQKHLWEQPWNYPITEQQLRQYIRLTGIINDVKIFCNHYLQHNNIPLSCLNAISVQQQVTHGIIPPINSYLVNDTWRCRSTPLKDIYVSLHRLLE